MSLQSVNRVSKGPSRFAIAGERFAVATTARTAAPRNKVFVSHLTGIDAKTSSSRSDMALPSLGREALNSPAVQIWGLQEVGGNARWLSSPCPRCIADGSARRTADPQSALGVEAARGLAGGVCPGRRRAAARPAVHAGGRFQLTTLRRAIPCQRRRSRSHNDGQRLSTRATISIGTISNHGFWRKYLAASGVNDGFGCAP